MIITNLTIENSTIELVFMNTTTDCSFQTLQVRPANVTVLAAITAGVYNCVTSNSEA